MLLVALAALSFQAAPPLDTTALYDSPATEALVERVVRAGSRVPPELRDYRAEIRTGVYLSLRSDSAAGGETPVTVDEFAGDVRWARDGGLLQTLRGHRVRLRIPVVYTVGGALEAPWVIPHLYGSRIDVFTFAATPRRPGRRRVSRALHPFSEIGRPYYRFTAGDTTRIRVGDRTVRLLHVEVRPVRPPPEGRQLVVGGFDVDLDLAAVARARIGFTDGAGERGFSQVGVFFDLENGLWQDRFWLPYRQRRELQLASPLLGGSGALRLVTHFSGYRLNTGWRPDSAGAERLVRDFASDSAFWGWDDAGADAAEWDIADFADLRRRVGAEASLDTTGMRTALHYERVDHLFRFNRVEGLFVGAGGRLEPRDPDGRWSLYGTAGWAAAEETARGEARARWQRPGAPWSANVGAYRRLRDTRSFRPVFDADWAHSLSAALGGYDVRDYLDAAGAEAWADRRWGNWTLSAGARWERQDSVGRNTDHYLFGEAEDFPPVGSIDPGTHAALEGEVRYARGSGAFGVGDGAVASLRGEQGVGDFRVARVIGALSARRSAGPLTLATRVDAGHVFGAAPPQMLLRFGEAEGLAAYAPNQFGGSSAAVGRARLLVGIPPRGSEPLARSGMFVVPPIRPALVISGSAAWAGVEDASRTALLRSGATVTDGVEATLGAGVSVFDDTVSAEWVWPAGRFGERELRVGLVRWF